MSSEDYGQYKRLKTNLEESSQGEIREIIDLNKYHYTPTRDLITNRNKDITLAIDSSHNLDEDIIEDKGNSLPIDISNLQKDYQALSDSMNIKTVHEGEIKVAIT